jgi:hypothetical protein
VCETSRLTRVACRIAGASRGSRRAPIHACGSARSPRDGSSCRTRTHRPCHAGPRSGCRTLGTLPGSGASRRGPSRRWGHTDTPSPSAAPARADELSQRSSTPPRRGNGAPALPPCGDPGHGLRSPSPATISLALECYRTLWTAAQGKGRLPPGFAERLQTACSPDRGIRSRTGEAPPAWGESMLSHFVVRLGRPARGSAGPAVPTHQVTRSARDASLEPPGVVCASQDSRATSRTRPPAVTG